MRECGMLFLSKRKEMQMTRRPARRRRHRSMPEYVQLEIMGCIMLSAAIIGIVGGPIAFWVFGG